MIKTPMKTFSQKKLWINSPSFALISVLALVSLAALTATAFLASARLERQATSSIGNATRLEMALNSGKVCASQVINDNSQADVGGNTHIVTYWRGNNVNDWTNELGYPFIGQIRTNGGRDNAIWHYFPLFSPAGVTNLDTNVIQTAMRFTNTHQGTFSNDMQAYMSSTNGTNGFVASPGLNHPRCVQIPLLGGRTSPPVGWVYLNQEKRRPGSNLTNTSPAVRIAWFAEDLEGLIDAERMGGLTSRPSGTNSEEISISNATGTNGALLSSVATFTNNRKAYISYGLLASTNVSGLANPTNARYFASGLRAWAPTNSALNNGALAWIPAGIPISGSSTAPKGYTNQGYTKLNLNNLVSGTPAASVANIAAVITNNLPGFTNRAGGMAGGTYVSNIAANIRDYADTDSDPTYIAPDVRGSEAVAWPNEIIYQVTFSNTDTLATGGGFQYAFKFKQYIETWNIHNTNVPTGSLSISNNLEILVRIPGTGGNTFSLASLATEDQKTQIATNVASAPATLRPGEFGMLETPEQTFIYFADGATNATNVIFQDCGNNQVVIRPTNSSSAPLTRTIAGMQIYSATKLGGTLTTGSGWLTANQFASAILAPNVYRSGVTTVGGDPRAQFFLRDWQVKCSPYVNYSSPGGRNYEQGNASFPNSEVNPQLFWPDGGRTIAGDKGANPGNFSQRPNTLYAGKVGTWSTNLSLARINNSGSFSNVCELGNIFDPMQWADTTQLPAAAGGQRGLWTNLSAAATNDPRFCGRSSLRIGRPEFTPFAFTNMYGNSIPSIPNMGMSSAALLDLFATTNGTSVAGGPYTLGGGKINLNTAPAPVLRALAGGIRLTSDPMLTGVGGSGTNFPIPSAMAEAFAQGVMRFRSKYPILTPSHLCFIGTDPSWPNTNTWPLNAVFGNTNSIALSTVPGNTLSTTRVNVTAWNDQAAEEWFSKIYALSSCQSHNFRIYVVAQLVATNSSGQTNAIGPLVKKYYQIYARNGSSAAALPDTTTYPGNTIYSWKPSVGVIDISKSDY
jgi:hypothetical protein